MKSLYEILENVLDTDKDVKDNIKLLTDRDEQLRAIISVIRDCFEIEKETESGYFIKRAKPKDVNKFQDKLQTLSFVDKVRIFRGIFKSKQSDYDVDIEVKKSYLRPGIPSSLTVRLNNKLDEIHIEDSNGKLL
jgi:hypothetical protein